MFTIMPTILINCTIFNRNLFEYSVGSDERLQIEIEIFNDGEVRISIIIVLTIVIMIKTLITMHQIEISKEGIGGPLSCSIV